MNENLLIAFIRATLDNERGISDEAYELLVKLVATVKNGETRVQIENLIDLNNACEGRFFIN